MGALSDAKSEEFASLMSSAENRLAPSSDMCDPTWEMCEGWRKSEEEGMPAAAAAAVAEEGAESVTP